MSVNLRFYKGESTEIQYNGKIRHIMVEGVYNWGIKAYDLIKKQYRSFRYDKIAWHNDQFSTYGKVNK